MHGDSIIILMLVVGWLMIARKRGFGPYGMRQRQMEQEIAELRAEKTALPRNVPTLDQVQMLEDRVRVLERIVTDQNYSLARDIEALRDPVDRRQTEEKI
jgi:hypothetical protein